MAAAPAAAADGRQWATRRRRVRPRRWARPRASPAGTAIAVPRTGRRAAADADQPGPPARHPPRPRRAARRGTRPGHHRPRPVPRPRRHRRPQPATPTSASRLPTADGIAPRPRLRHVRPPRPARRTHSTPGGAARPGQPHRHRRPSGRNARETRPAGQPGFGRPTLTRRLGVHTDRYPGHEGPQRRAEHPKCRSCQRNHSSPSIAPPAARRPRLVPRLDTDPALGPGVHRGP